MNIKIVYVQCMCALPSIHDIAALAERKLQKKAYLLLYIKSLNRLKSFW